MGKAGHCGCHAGFTPSLVQALVGLFSDGSSESSVWSLGASLDLSLPQGVCDNADSQFSNCSPGESGKTLWELISVTVQPIYSSDVCWWQCSVCHTQHPGWHKLWMAGSGTLHPRGSQACAHTNKIHISMISLHGYLPWTEFSCPPVLFSPPAHILTAFPWLCSARALCVTGSAHPAASSP